MVLALAFFWGLTIQTSKRPLRDLWGCFFMFKSIFLKATPGYYLCVEHGTRRAQETCSGPYTNKTECREFSQVNRFTMSKTSIYRTSSKLHPKTVKAKAYCRAYRVSTKNKETTVIPQQFHQPTDMKFKK